MRRHEVDAGVQVPQNLTKRFVVNQSPGTGGVQTPCDVVEVHVEVDISADFVRKLFEAVLFREQVLALRLERRCLGFHGLERVGECREKFQRCICVVDERIKMSFRERQLVLVEQILLLADFEKLFVVLIQDRISRQTGVPNLLCNIQRSPGLVLPPSLFLLQLVLGQLSSNDVVEVGVRLGVAQNRGFRGRVRIYNVLENLVEGFRCFRGLRDALREEQLSSANCLSVQRPRGPERSRAYVGLLQQRLLSAVTSTRSRRSLFGHIWHEAVPGVVVHEGWLRE